MTIFGKILLGLILVTGAVLIIKGGPKDDDLLPEPVDTAETAAAETAAPEDANAFRGSTRDLMARGGNHVCTFTQEVENSTSTGTVYISGTKMRGDSKSDVSAAGTSMSVESHMISDGEFMYMWSSMMPTGFKMAVAEDTTVDGTAPASQQMFDANMDLSYDCDPWTPDASKFTLPSTTTFTEFSA